MKPAPSSSAAKRQIRNARQLASQKRLQALTAKGPTAFEELRPIHRRAAGIDVGSAENYVAIPSDLVSEGESAVRVFGVFSADQQALVEWLQQHQITTVAMEATGIYWVTLYDLLEAVGMEVYLVDPHGVKALPGRKSDWMDCQWLLKLHTYGLLQRAFRPDLAIRRLRKLTRQRTELVCAGVAHQQHMEKAMIAMNLQLGLVVSDLVGESGLAIIQAILKGERDAEVLAKLRDPRCRKANGQQWKEALQGTYNEEDLFVLEQSLEGWRFYQRQIEACDGKIATALEAIPTAAPGSLPPPPKPVALAADQTQKPKRIPRGNNAPSVNFTEVLKRICGVNLMAIPGLNLLSVLMLLGEIGTDMSRWRSARAFCSWLGLSPGTKISGGKVLSRRTRKVVNRASTILRMAAVVAGRTDTWIGRFYRRIRARKGAPKAVTATARKLACLVYHLLKYREEYAVLDTTSYERTARAHRLRYLQKAAKVMGFQLVELEDAA
jgi:transposase